MRNFKGNPELALEFEYLLRLGHKRKDTDKIPVLFENLTPTKLDGSNVPGCEIFMGIQIWNQNLNIRSA